MVPSTQVYMFKCQKQVEITAHRTHILSITLETTAYLNDSDKTTSVTTLEHHIWQKKFYEETCAEKEREKKKLR